MLPCLDAFNNVWQAARLSASSAQYRRWNSFHLAGSWLNQRRRSSLGARFLHHASMCSASFFIPRGHRRSTRKRAPSSFVEGSYTRLIWITAKLLLRTLNLDSHRPSAAALLVSCPRNRRYFAGSQLAVFFKARTQTHILLIRVERATPKNSQLAPARRVAMKMGRRRRCSSVTYRLRHAPPTASPARTALPAAHFD